MPEKQSVKDLEWFVYKHTNLSNGKVYIGITHDIHKRWRGSGCAYKSNHHFWQAIKKYGWDGFSHEVLYKELSYSDACKYEIELIKKYNACNREFGYNKSPGGDSPLVIYTGNDHHFFGKHLSDDHRKKLSESHKGEKHFWFGKHLPEETRKKIGDANRGRPQSEEQKKRLREVNLGRKATEETKRKMSLAQKGRVRDADIGKRISDAKEKKRVAQMSCFGEPIQIWSSISAAAKEYGLTTGSICKCCKGVLKSSGGFIWAYEENINLSDFATISDELRRKLIEEGVRRGNKKQRKCVEQLALDGSLLTVWPSLTKAAQENGMEISAICRCCKGIVRTAGGYIWRYVDSE